MTQELFFSVSWKVYNKVDLNSEHVCSCYPCCFLLLVIGEWRTGENRRSCSKTSWTNMVSADCVVWAGPSRLATQRCLIINNPLR